jgi:hypothetical protein
MVEAERVRIGSAAYCEVRLPQGEAAAVQIVLEDAGPLGLMAEVVSESPPAILAGKPIISGVLPPKAELEIGSTRLQIACVGGALVGAGPAAKQKTSPVTLLAAAIAIPLGLAQLTMPAKDDELASGHKPPALFASAAVSCSQSEPISALALAAEQRELANAKRERRPFRAFDGVQAVGLYRVTAACFRAGGDARQSVDAEHAADVLRRDLDESYRTRRVRLEHALTTKNYQVAQSEVRALRDITTGMKGEYVSWLESLQRRLRLRQGKKP